MAENAQEAQSAVAEPETVKEQKEKQDKKPKRQPRYNVILWDDQDHHNYVINMVQKLFGFPQPQGYKIAVEVDTRGRCIVLTTTREHAELKRDQIHAYGKDELIAGCKGSMTCTIEPMPE